MEHNKQKQRQLLLLEDVLGLGRQGELVVAKPGYVRNFLLPKKKAVVADKFTLRLQARLQEERSQKAAVDRKDAEALAKTLIGQRIKAVVKTDTQGKLYGSVTNLEIANLAKEAGFLIERQNVILAYPIKSLGVHKVALRLKEGVEASIELEVLPEHPESIVKKKEVVSEENDAKEEKAIEEGNEE